MRSVSPQWLLSNLFTFIWTILRETPESNEPEWRLKEALDAFTSDGENCKKISSKILCKHAVDLFISVNNYHRQTL